MARRRMGWIDGACYHITHRCHKREFLFKFAKYRELYIRQLWEMKRRFKVDILDYMITSNHVHLLLTARHGRNISGALQFLHGSVGQQYNLHKERQGAFWSDRFHATRLQNGDHLRRCLFYIDLNMVRTGTVKHPAEWDYCAVDEFLGQRKRYLVVNMKRLLQRLDIGSEEEFRTWYLKTLTEKLAGISHRREGYWSEAVAVGDPDWLPQAAKDAGVKRYEIKTDESADIKFFGWEKIYSKLIIDGSKCKSSQQSEFRLILFYLKSCVLMVSFKHFFQGVGGRILRVNTKNFIGYL